MSNPANTVTVIGRLAADPYTATNSNNSTSVKFTVMADNNFKSRDGKVKAEPITVQDFVSADHTLEQTVYSRMHQGDLVAISGSLTAVVYTDKVSGETVRKGLTVRVDSVDLLEPKGVVDPLDQVLAELDACRFAPGTFMDLADLMWRHGFKTDGQTIPARVGYLSLDETKGVVSFVPRGHAAELPGGPGLRTLGPLEP
jgi:single-stranded DNA-binding protein